MIFFKTCGNFITQALTGEAVDMRGRHPPANKLSGKPLRILMQHLKGTGRNGKTVAENYRDYRAKIKDVKVR